MSVRSKFESPIEESKPDAKVAREWAQSESQSGEYVGLFGGSPTGADAMQDGRPVKPRKPSQRPDSSIVDDIRSRFDASSELEGTKIEVQAVRGEVTLIGDVRGKAEHDAAMAIAARVYGVTFVHDQLRLRE